MEQIDPARIPGPETVLFGLLSVGHLVDDRLNGALEPHGLSLPKFSVLQRLAEADEPLPLGVLSERLGCVKSNVTQLVDRLEADHLVQRLPDADDRRSVRASITAAGRERCAAGQQALTALAHELVAGLSHQDRAQLAGLLDRLVPSLRPE